MKKKKTLIIVISIFVISLISIFIIRNNSTIVNRLYQNENIYIDYCKNDETLYQRVAVFLKNYLMNNNFNEDEDSNNLTIMESDYRETLVERRKSFDLDLKERLDSTFASAIPRYRLREGYYLLYDKESLLTVYIQFDKTLRALFERKFESVSNSLSWCSDYLVSAQTKLNNSNEYSKEKVYSESFVAHMQKAIEYEDSKKWIWALDEYYNTIISSKNNEEADIAYEAYKDLADIIESGKPGRGEFDRFSMYEEWRKLLIEAEDYGNNIFPYELYFGSFKAENINLREKIGDYSVPIAYHLSCRYFKTIGVIAKGYEKVDKNGWTELPKQFPGEPISKDSLSIEISSQKKSSFAFSIGNLNFPDGNSVIPYEGIFIIKDRNGNVLAESEPYVIGTKLSGIQSNGLLPGIFSYQQPSVPFKNIPESVIKEIDAGNAYMQLKKVSILYGKVQAENDINAQRYIQGNDKKEIGCYFENIHYQGSGMVGRARAKFFEKAITNVCEVNFRNCVLLNSKETFKLVFGRDDVILDITNFMILCNELSKIVGREPIYKVNESSEVCDIIANSSSGKKSIVPENGFWAPSIEDIEMILESFKDAPVLKKKSGLIYDSYNYYLLGENSTEDANLLVYFGDKKN